MPPSFWPITDVPTASAEGTSRPLNPATFHSASPGPPTRRSRAFRRLRRSLCPTSEFPKLPLVPAEPSRLFCRRREMQERPRNGSQAAQEARTAASAVPGHIRKPLGDERQGRSRLLLRSRNDGRASRRVSASIARLHLRALGNFPNALHLTPNRADCLMVYFEDFRDLAVAPLRGLL